MCDTILAPPATTGERAMLFGKNSDRSRNEAQAVEYVAAAEHASGSDVQCTYIAIPQVPRTQAILICRPFWIWGAEMGANEHGVVIGNEGLRAKTAAPEKPAMVGMDLLRLALERASTAAEAVEVIAKLLERYGQGGNCGHLAPVYYQNGFMIADSESAFVLETVDREWIVERVQDVRAFSNTYTIERDPHSQSAGMHKLVRSLGWTEQGEVGYGSALADMSREHIGNATGRAACSASLLGARRQALNVADMMCILRDHGTGDYRSQEWQPDCAVTRTVCMHAGDETRSGQTVGSMVAEMRRGTAVHWVTATAASCISIFKPVMLDVPLPSHGPRLTDRFDPDALWWRHERLHRTALDRGFAQFVASVRAERDAIEADFRRRMHVVCSDGTRDDRARVVRDCWQEAMQLEESWWSRIAGAHASSEDDTPERMAWRRMNQLAGMAELSPL